MAATTLAVFPWLTIKLFRHISVTGPRRAQDFATSESASKGKGTRRRNTNARAKNNNPTAGQTSVHSLPDEILDRVLLHLDSPLHLVRAAATCRRWRRAVAAGDFLARFSALHGGPPRVDGHYYVTNTRQPADAPAMKLVMFVPTAASAAVRGLFSLDFLYPGLIKPKPGVDLTREYQWATLTRQGRRGMEIVDSRGSLLLLNTAGARRSPDFVVCEPVTRGYQAIASPAGLDRFLFLGAFVLDGDGGGGGAANTMSDFRVLSVLCEVNKTYWDRGTPRACVFGPGTDGGWQLGWHTTDDDVEVRPVQLGNNPIHLAGRVAGRIYWGMETGTVLVLDEGTLKFSLLTLPEHMRWPYKNTSFRVIGGVDDDTVRVVRMYGEELAVYGQLPAGSGQWVIEKSVRLRDAAAGLPGWKDSFLTLAVRIVTVGETFVVLTPEEENWLFSVELDTMEVEREHERNWHDATAYPCALPWPPVLKACVDHRDIVGKRRQRRRRRKR